MGKPQKISLKEAANLIQDGDFLAFSGFTIWRRPMALIYEMVRQGKKDLHLFEVNGGTHTEVLAGAGAIKMWESCWVGHELCWIKCLCLIYTTIPWRFWNISTNWGLIL
jgi:glutaconate CoA-transferase subunit A